MKNSCDCNESNNFGDSCDTIEPDNSGEFGDSGWNWDLTYHYGKNDSAAIAKGYFNLAKVAQQVGPTYTDDSGSKPDPHILDLLLLERYKTTKTTTTTTTVLLLGRPTLRSVTSTVVSVHAQNQTPFCSSVCRVSLTRGWQ